MHLCKKDSLLCGLLTQDLRMIIPYAPRCLGNTVKPLLNDHPRQLARRSVNRGFLKLRPRPHEDDCKRKR